MEEKEEEGGGGDCARQGRGNCKIVKEKEEGEPGENIWMHDQAPSWLLPFPVILPLIGVTLHLMTVSAFD